MNTEKFFTVFQKAVKLKIIIEIYGLSDKFNPINLDDETTLSFLAPIGNDYYNFSDNQARYLTHKTTSIPDFNSLSTIIEIKNSIETVLLTSDANKKAFKRIINKIKLTVQLAQVPHHGSFYNLLPNFWKSLTRKDNCPAVFSIGNVKKDKLPNKEVVEYFDNEGYYNVSTNFVYGIAEVYGAPLRSHPLSLSLSSFSSLKSSTDKETTSKPRFIGDKHYSLL